MVSDHIKCRGEVAWDEGTLGLSEEHAVAAPGELEAQVDESLRLQMISIRLQKDLIEDLKLIAGKESLGYQPLIRRVLQRFVAAEFRSMALEGDAMKNLTPTRHEDDRMAAAS